MRKPCGVMSTSLILLGIVGLCVLLRLHIGYAQNRLMNGEVVKDIPAQNLLAFIN